MDLPKPEVVRCFFEGGFQPPLPAMELCWDANTPAACERTWRLPDGLLLYGPAPCRFGITIQRQGQDAYQMRVLWNRLCLRWDGLPRVQIMTSSLVSVLNALGTDLWYLLNQPLEREALLQVA